MKLKYLIVVFLLSACSTTPEQPTPFEPKEITPPPYGCVELRKQGGDC